MSVFSMKCFRILCLTATVLSGVFFIAHRSMNTAHTESFDLFRLHQRWNGVRMFQTCETLKFSSEQRPLTGFVSFPGSGNTWLRHLLQETTGLLTGSEYNDTDLRSDGFVGEGVSNESTILVKTHGYDETTRERYAKIVLLIRHPRDAILAEFHRRNSGSHTGKASLQQFQAHWSSFLRTHSRAWYDFHQGWLRYSRPMLLIKFTDLQTKPLMVLKQLLLFLKIPTDKDRLHCTFLNSHKYKRQNTEGDLPDEIFEENFKKSLNRMYQLTLQEFAKLSTQAKLRLSLDAL